MKPTRVAELGIGVTARREVRDERSRGLPNCRDGHLPDRLVGLRADLGEMPSEADADERSSCGSHVGLDRVSRGRAARQRQGPDSAGNSDGWR